MLSEEDVNSVACSRILGVSKLRRYAVIIAAPFFFFLHFFGGVMGIEQHIPEAEHIPWDKYGALLTIVVIVLYVLVEMVFPWWREKKLKRPVKAYFHIQSEGQGKVDYLIQDDMSHSVKCLVLPSHLIVNIEIAYYALIPLEVQETVFGFDSTSKDKPEILALLNGPFVSKGELNAPTPYWDREARIHYQSRLTGSGVDLPLRA